MTTTKPDDEDYDAKNEKVEGKHVSTNGVKTTKHEVREPRDYYC